MVWKEHPDQSHKYRRDILRILLWISISACSLYSVINLSRGLWSLGLLELGYVIFSLALCRIVYSTRHLQRWVMIYIGPMLFLVTYAITLPTTTDTLFSWILIIPVVAHLLLGSHHGLWVSIVFVSVNVINYQLRFVDDDTAPLHIAVDYNIFLSSMAITLFSHLCERNRERTEARLLELATTDQLTGLLNRAKLITDFQNLRAQADRANIPMVVVMIDLDHFKQVNDNHGHDMGDRALVHAADLIRSYTREVDIKARMGGEEFAVIMPDTTTEEGALIINRLRRVFSATPLRKDNQVVNLTFSAGISEYKLDGVELDRLIMCADRRLYLAKENGRNQVVAKDLVPVSTRCRR